MIGRLPELATIANVTSSMTFRDDRDALFARLEAVLHENAVLQRQNAELQRARSPEPVPLPGGIVACVTCGRPNDFRKSDCAYCGAALRRNDSFGNTLRGHAPAPLSNVWPDRLSSLVKQAINESTHGPDIPLVRTPSAWNVIAGVLLAVLVLGFFIAIKLLVLDGVG